MRVVIESLFVSWSAQLSASLIGESRNLIELRRHFYIHLAVEPAGFVIYLRARIVVSTRALLRSARSDAGSWCVPKKDAPP